MSQKISDLLQQITSAANSYDAAVVETVSIQLVKQIRKDIAVYPTGFVNALDEAIQLFDRNLAQKLCNELINHLRSTTKPYPLPESKQILGILRRKRYFDLITQVADVLLQTGLKEANIGRQYAQALIDRNFISAALNVLQNLESYCLEIKDHDELAEVCGLIGRAHKQIYINANSGTQPPPELCRHIEQAITAYLKVYEENKEYIWHGINTVALLERAKYDQIDDKIFREKTLPSSVEISNDILEYISSKKKPDLWDYATAGEACLALKDYAQSFAWIYKYTQQTPDADAFEYASTLRQFEEVWQLDEDKTNHAKILHLLREAVMRQEGGQVEINNLAQTLTTASALKEDKQFEQILGKDRYKTFQWYCTGLDRAAGVAQILDKNGNGQGSGFLVRGSDVHQNLGEDWVVVTNAHVISDDPLEQSASPSSLPSEEARIRFEAIDPKKQYSVKEILFSSSRLELDCTIVTLQSQVKDITPYPIAKRLPLAGKNQRVYIIGHPRGGGLAYSIDDNLLLDHEKPKVHYRTPTEGGSSGSPVFNQQWDLIALHHAGGMNIKKLNKKPGYYPANEGLWFQSIRNAVAAKLELTGNEAV